MKWEVKQIQKHGGVLLSYSSLMIKSSRGRVIFLNIPLTIEHRRILIKSSVTLKLKELSVKAFEID